MAYTTLHKGLDFPNGQLLQESDFSAEVFCPKLHNDQWQVCHIGKGEQFHTNDYFETEQEAESWANHLSEFYGVPVRTW